MGVAVGLRPCCVWVNVGGSASRAGGMVVGYVGGFWGFRMAPPFGMVRGAGGAFVVFRGGLVPSPVVHVSRAPERDIAPPRNIHHYPPTPTIPPRKRRNLQQLSCRSAAADPPTLTTSLRTSSYP